MSAPEMNTPRTISLAPNWQTAAMIYIAALENGTAAGQQAARAGIMEMAEKFDRLIARVQEGDDATETQTEGSRETGA